MCKKFIPLIANHRPRAIRGDKYTTHIAPASHNTDNNHNHNQPATHARHPGHNCHRADRTRPGRRERRQCERHTLERGQLHPAASDVGRHKTVPGLDKPANHIHITPDTVTLIVPHCSKEPTHSATINVTADSPLLAEMLRLYEPVAREKNQGFLFRPCSLSARKKRRPRAMLKLLGKHYTAIDSRHKHVAAALGSVQERQEMAHRMGTSGAMLNRYGDGAGTAGQ